MSTPIINTSHSQMPTSSHIMPPTPQLPSNDSPPLPSIMMLTPSLIMTSMPSTPHISYVLPISLNSSYLSPTSTFPLISYYHPYFTIFFKKSKNFTVLLIPFYYLNPISNFLIISLYS